MTQTGEIERFAARLRMLKERAGTSYEALAAQTGISRSSLHRYCSGAKVPATYGAVHTFAKACGATGEELRELHRLWALADAARSDPATSADEQDDEAPSDGHPPARSPSGENPSGRDRSGENPSDGGRSDGGLSGAGPVADVLEPPPVADERPRRRRLVAAVAATVLAVSGATAFAMLRSDSEQPPSIVENESGAATVASVRVHNVEGDCGSRADRPPACSLGLARDPRQKYAAGNVVEHRVWHGDVLKADCVLYDGDRVEDETGVGTTRWFRVLLHDVPGGHAWLPAVRTNDHPSLPVCA
ncbi:helix-turn-helix transcriptional regulator [Nonomuraea sp. NPDC046802]|uniref:helix-turn-helix domain-containing protein n=1 Tax=Nonomuraea sp. NPDC046802 TaxID=3154919 RepID=UPI0034046DB0